VAQGYAPPPRAVQRSTNGPSSHTIVAEPPKWCPPSQAIDAVEAPTATFRASSSSGLRTLASFAPMPSHAAAAASYVAGVLYAEKQCRPSAVRAGLAPPVGREIA